MAGVCLLVGDVWQEEYVKRYVEEGRSKSRNWQRLGFGSLWIFFIELGEMHHCNRHIYHMRIIKFIGLKLSPIHKTVIRSNICQRITIGFFLSNIS